MTKQEAMKLERIHLARRMETGRLIRVMNKTRQELSMSRQEMQKKSVYCN